jgi:hypothetical protein
MEPDLDLDPLVRGTDSWNRIICRPFDSTVSEVAGIEPRTVATLALTVRRSNQLARSYL